MTMLKVMHPQRNRAPTVLCFSDELRGTAGTLGYGSGDAEELMGAAIAMGIEREYWTREDLVITTKIFNGTPARWAEGAMTMNRSGLSRKHLYEGLKASLRRFNLEYIDCVFCHSVDPVTPIEEVVRAFNILIDKGMCFYWGTSTWTARDAWCAARSTGATGAART